MLSKSPLGVSELIQQKIAEILSYKYIVHPFSTFVTSDNLEEVLRNYCAMSEAFPFLQAGSQKELIFDCINRGASVGVDMELTSVVANFLCWDETGGHYVLLKNGMPGLPEILNTGKYFHSNLLKGDLQRIFGQSVHSSYSSVTRNYLHCLYQGFASLSPIVRCASMVAFESHAAQMIDALWNRISALRNIARDELIYFKVHVGGDDPAEAYHVKMTSGMIENIIQPENVPLFMEEFDKAYNLSYSWCRDITLSL